MECYVLSPCERLVIPAAFVFVFHLLMPCDFCQLRIGSTADKVGGFIFIVTENKTFTLFKDKVVEGPDGKHLGMPVMDGRPISLW